MRRVVVAAVICLVTLILLGCKEPPSQFTSLDWSPRETKPLVVGDTVTFSVNGTYSLQAKSGFVGIFIQDGQDKVLARKFVSVAGGDGSFAISAPAKISETKQIVVGIALFKEIASGSVDAVPVRYTVAPHSQAQAAASNNSLERPR